jgi:hypothetical protein
MRIKEMVSRPVPKEREASLMICADNPQQIAKEISDLSSIAHYKLASTETRKIQINDIYFDTTKRSLHKKKLALRIREVEGKYWITLKGNSQQNGIAAVERDENEQEWSDNASRNIITQLRNLESVTEIQEKSDYKETDPINTLESVGLERIQERLTCRKKIGIVNGNGNDKNRPVLAELDIDRVEYNFFKPSSRKISIYNIEIEEKEKIKEGDTSPSVVSTLVEWLISTYGQDLLRGWIYGKFALGKGIEKLLNEEGLEVDANTYLKCNALDEIERYIRDGII